MDFLTRKEVATYFRVSERTIDRWVQNGLLKGYKLGSGRTALWRFSKVEVKKFLEKGKSN